MARIFLSHSSSDNAAAIALRDWLLAEGWEDLFLDLDPDRGIAAGERWERALSDAANRCEAAVFLISRAWLGSAWCRREMMLALRLNKQMFGVVIDETPTAEIHSELAGAWQLINLAAGADHRMFRAALPDGSEAHVTFSALGLAKLKAGLTKAGLDPRFFVWPPKDEPDRPPWRGMLPMDAGDAGVFFGRDGPLIEAMDRLRGMANGAPPRFLAILGASGAGKSSFLRAGLLPRLARDDRHFLVLPTIRPERAVLSGEAEGLVSALVRAAATAGLPVSRAGVAAAVAAGAAGVRPLLGQLVEAASPTAARDEGAFPPVVVLPLDQAEELFNATGRDEADRFLALLRDLLAEDPPRLICLATIRSDTYDRLQSVAGLEGIRQQTFSLPPLPRGQWANVIEGPAARASAAGRKLKLDPALTAALLTEADAGGGRDALPLLAFTLGRLYHEHGGKGALALADYHAMGGIAGSVDASVERAFARADSDPGVPRDRDARLLLLRRGLIPWLAGIDPDTGAARRLSARLSDIPAEARTLIEHLVAERLLSKEQVWKSDDGGTLTPAGEPTIEPVHEALLRQWGLLRGWLEEDFALLNTLESLRRAARDWHANADDPAWLNHRAGRLEDAERLADRPDLWARLDQTDRAYLGECRAAENRVRDDRERQLREIADGERRRAEAERGKRRWAVMGSGVAAVLAVLAVIAGLFGLKQAAETRRQAALLSIDTATRIASEGATDAALGMLIDASAVLGEAAPDRLLVALERVTARAAREVRHLVSAGTQPFEIENRLYLLDPASGQVQVVDASGELREAFTLPGRLITVSATDTPLGHVLAVQVDGHVEFHGLGDGASDPVLLATGSLVGADLPDVNIGPDGRAIVDYGTSGSDARRHELFDLAGGRQITVAEDDLYLTLRNNRLGQSYLAFEEDSALLDLAEGLGFAWSLTQDPGGDLTYTCLGADLARVTAIRSETGESLLDAVPGLFAGNEYDAFCALRGDYLLMATYTSISSGQFRTTIVERVDQYFAGLSDVPVNDLSDIPGRVSPVDLRPPSLFADDAGYTLVEPQVRELYIEREDHEFDDAPRIDSIRFATRIEAAVAVSRDRGAVVLSPVGSAAVKELVLVDLRPDAMRSETTDLDSIAYEAWMKRTGNRVSQPWVGHEDPEDPDLRVPGFVVPVWRGPVDPAGFRTAYLEIEGPQGGEWRLPDPRDAETRLRLSPGGEWYAYEAADRLSVYRRDGTRIAERQVRRLSGRSSAYVDFSFRSVEGPALLLAELEPELRLWGPGSDGAWRETVVHIPNHLVLSVDAFAGSDQAMLILSLGQRSYLARRISFRDGAVWPDTPSWNHLQNNLALSDGAFLLNESWDSWAILPPPDLDDLLRRAGDLMSPHCRPDPRSLCSALQF